MEDYNEVICTAWLVAGWNLVKELFNKAPSLVSMSKNCWQWEGGATTEPGVFQTRSAPRPLSLLFILFYCSKLLKQSSTVRRIICLGVYFCVELYAVEGLVVD